MHFRPEHYKDAAAERVDTAQRMYDAGRFCESIYLAGLATESILRAYRSRRNPEFDSRHDLADLLKVSNLAAFVPQAQRPKVGASLGDVWSRWKNDYRFASTDRLLADFRARKLDRGIAGDVLKANAIVALNGALHLVGIGVARWNKTSETE